MFLVVSVKVYAHYRNWQINGINRIKIINGINKGLIDLCKLGPGLIQINIKRACPYRPCSNPCAITYVVCTDKYQAGLFVRVLLKSMSKISGRITCLCWLDSLPLATKIPISHKISKIPFSIGVKSQLFPWNLKIPGG